MLIFLFGFGLIQFWTTGRNEAKFIEKIVYEVETKLNLVHPSVTDCPVGIESRLQKLTKFLCTEADDICIVAIWGIAGIGKTTIANC